MIKQRNKLWHIAMMEQCSAMKRSEWGTDAVTWMDLALTMLMKGEQTERAYRV